MTASPTMPLPDETETSEQLAAKAQAGCLVSYERLVLMHQDRLFTFLAQMVGNDHDAQDIAQETFVKVYKHLGSFDGRARFSTWLYAIAKNTALNHLRRRRDHQSIEELAEVLPSDEPPFDENERQSIWAAARTLKPHYFETLWLFYAEGFSLREVAEIMGANSITVRVNLHRARAALGKKLQRMNSAVLAPAALAPRFGESA